MNGVVAAERWLECTGANLRWTCHYEERHD